MDLPTRITVEWLEEYHFKANFIRKFANRYKDGLDFNRESLLELIALGAPPESFASIMLDDFQGEEFGEAAEPIWDKYNKEVNKAEAARNKAIDSAEAALARKVKAVAKATDESLGVVLADLMGLE